MTANHFIVKCKKCGGTISQCRCPSKDKSIQYSLCECCASNPEIANSSTAERKLKPVDENCLYKQVLCRINISPLPNKSNEKLVSCIYLGKSQAYYRNVAAAFFCEEQKFCDCVDYEDLQRIPGYDYGDGGNYETEAQ
jgi:RecJ-like exonuclease